LSRIELIHSKNFIHRDVKPENFLASNDKKKKQIIYLIDYGLIKRYKDKDENHINYIEGKDFIGTAKFASINTHLGIEQSRRDDLESIAYLLIYCLVGYLPWMSIENSNKKLKYLQIMESKKTMDLTKDFSGYKLIKRQEKRKTTEYLKSIPIEFTEFLNYTKNLKFDEAPDYDYLKKLLLKISENENLTLDYIYDWDEEEAYKEEKEKVKTIVNQGNQLNQPVKLNKIIFGNNKFLTGINK